MSQVSDVESGEIQDNQIDSSQSVDRNKSSELQTKQDFKQETQGDRSHKHRRPKTRSPSEERNPKKQKQKVIDSNTQQQQKSKNDQVQNKNIQSLKDVSGDIQRSKYDNQNNDMIINNKNKFYNQVGKNQIKKANSSENLFDGNNNLQTHYQSKDGKIQNRQKLVSEKKSVDEKREQVIKLDLKSSQDERQKNIFKDVKNPLQSEDIPQNQLDQNIALQTNRIQIQKKQNKGLELEQIENIESIKIKKKEQSPDSSVQTQPKKSKKHKKHKKHKHKEADVESNEREGHGRDNQGKDQEKLAKRESKKLKKQLTNKAQDTIYSPRRTHHSLSPDSDSDRKGNMIKDQITEKHSENITDQKQVDLQKQKKQKEKDRYIDDSKKQKGDINHSQSMNQEVSKRVERDKSERRERDKSERRDRDRSQKRDRDRDRNERRDRDRNERRDRDRSGRRDRDGSERRGRDRSERRDRDKMPNRNTERSDSLDGVRKDRHRERDRSGRRRQDQATDSKHRTKSKRDKEKKQKKEKKERENNMDDFDEEKLEQTIQERKREQEQEETQKQSRVQELRQKLLGLKGMQDHPQQQQSLSQQQNQNDSSGIGEQVQNGGIDNEYSSAVDRHDVIVTQQAKQQAQTNDLQKEITGEGEQSSDEEERELQTDKQLDIFDGRTNQQDEQAGTTNGIMEQFKSIFDDDDEQDDIFKGLSNERLEKSLYAAKNRAQQIIQLNDSYDDAEGYFKINIGDIIDTRYEIQFHQGKGVFSSVIRAKDRARRDESGQHVQVAIKIIRANETTQKSGEHEIKILKKLSEGDPENKRHCIRLQRDFWFKGHLCLVFEPLDMNLRELTKKYGRGIGISINAVVHADVKPDNILVNQKRTSVKLCDFGSAFFMSSFSQEHITPYMVSRFYRAPEIILGQKYDHNIDTWSIACVLYELYVGQILFPGRTNNEMLKLIMEVKGSFPKKMLRAGEFANQHFSAEHNYAFVTVEEDPITKLPTKKLVPNIQITRSFKSKLSRTDNDRRKAEDLIDLLDKMTALQPENRIQPDDIMKHPFLRPYIITKKQHLAREQQQNAQKKSRLGNQIGKK